MERLDIGERARLNARQGVRYHLQRDARVLDPQTMKPVPWDGETMGEIMFRGNIVMKGYLKNAKATREAFAGGWFHTGDLAVQYPDGYIKIKDRSKDIIISGGENISSIEVEDVLYRHPDGAGRGGGGQAGPEVGRDAVRLRRAQGRRAVTAEDVVAHCKKHLAGFKVPQRGGVRRTAEDLDRQDPEVRAAQAGGLGRRDRRLTPAGGATPRRRHTRRMRVLSPPCLGAGHPAPSPGAC